MPKPSNPRWGKISIAQDDRIVVRRAPRWAWETIDETLAMDGRAGNFDPDLRVEIRAALEAMTEAES